MLLAPLLVSIMQVCPYREFVSANASTLWGIFDLENAHCNVSQHKRVSAVALRRFCRIGKSLFDP